MREVVHGLVSILSTSCQWRAIPKDLPPKSTLFDYLGLWANDGTLDRIHHTLYVAWREQGEREASPTAAIIDSGTREKRRTLRQAQEGACIDPRGYDAGNPSTGSGDQG